MFSFILIIMPIASFANHIVIGQGRVNMQGAIIDTACAIKLISREQTVDMAIVTLNDIISNEPGSSKPFSIELTSCALEQSDSSSSAWKYFQMTFDGDAQGDGFGLHGSTSGISLQINDADGNIARPGTPLPSRSITSWDMKLNYTVRLVANNPILKSGKYFSSVRFKLDYF
ncbi:type 1 fimbrial protein [Serratia sp. arafor3]|uniref:Type 1 fimbrial protein n=2 Tax=Serratia silvae TaxID=2824122 RepID=A0ABT0KH03_9GAMM|nr:type 1 fimbrial protein [Serratia silvae]